MWILRKLWKRILDWVASEHVKLIEFHLHVYGNTSFIIVFILNQINPSKPMDYHSNRHVWPYKNNIHNDKTFCFLWCASWIFTYDADLSWYSRGEIVVITESWYRKFYFRKFRLPLGYLFHLLLVFN
jgi:hypothetical protein